MTIGELEIKFNELKKDFEEHQHTGIDNKGVTALRLAGTPLPLVSAPVGGATIDAEARAAINTVITRLETIKIIRPN